MPRIQYVPRDDSYFCSNCEGRRRAGELMVIICPHPHPGPREWEWICPTCQLLPAIQDTINKYKALDVEDALLEHDQ